MHPTAMNNGKIFFDTYLNAGNDKWVVEIGSQNVNGSLRQVCPVNCKYTGLDFAFGLGVDIVLEDPYVLPLEANSVDCIVSSSCFEHSEMFWVVFLEILRVLKPNGLFYLNVPSNGVYHKYPVDCWRFYPDSGGALCKWGQRNGYSPIVLEHYTCQQFGDIWNDFVCVFLKDASFLDQHPNRILEKFRGCSNGFIYGQPNVINPKDINQDQEKLLHIQQIIRS